MHVEHFEIAERFCGPPRSGNGGYVCGRMAKHLTGTVSARLKAPPPLGKLLRLETHADRARLFIDEEVIGEAMTAELDVTPPPPITLDEAREATPNFVGHNYHQFPRCFVCGPQREPGDGLRIFPGLVTNAGILAAPWVPDASLADRTGSVASEFLWAALDCTGGFAVLPVLEGVAAVLGELTVQVLAPVAPGEPSIVVGWSLGVQGRKRFAGSAVYSDDGRVLGLGRAVWIDVPLSTWT